MSTEISEGNYQQLDAVEHSILKHNSEICGDSISADLTALLTGFTPVANITNSTVFISTVLLTESGTLTVFGGSGFSDPLTDQSDNPILT
jgi:hypothetical protein